MGLRKFSLEFVHEIIDNILLKFKLVEMLDLGNTYIRGSGFTYVKENYEMDGFSLLGDNNCIIAKEYFTALGFNHTSIDLNQKENSLPVDLRFPIKGNDIYNLLNKFDIILDIGTVEHIDNQYMCFKNLYDVCKIDGYIIHVLPLEGYWPDHCKYKYNFEFFKKLSEINKYQVHRMGIRNVDNLCICLQKSNNNNAEFMKEDDFQNLPLVIEPGNDFNDRKLYPYAY